MKRRDLPARNFGLMTSAIVALLSLGLCPNMRANITMLVNQLSKFENDFKASLASVVIAGIRKLERT